MVMPFSHLKLRGLDAWGDSMLRILVPAATTRRISAGTSNEFYSKSRKMAFILRLAVLGSRLCKGLDLKE